MKLKKIAALAAATLIAHNVVACGTAKSDNNTEKDTTESQTEKTTELKGTITLAAAASLQNVFVGKLIPMFKKIYPDVTIEGTYDSSGKLQSQIEEGAAVDVFFSAATQQMNELSNKGMIADKTIVELLENKIVMIVPKGKEKDYTGFKDIVNADSVAIGDPDSVPAGQYAKELLTNLELWKQVKGKLSLGTNVTEVLNWVGNDSAQVGIVYATDAESMEDQVSVVAEAPKGSCSKVIYPVAMTAKAQNPKAAQAFIKFLQTPEAATVFKAAGFSMN